MSELEKKSSAFDYLEILLKWRRFIVLNVAVVTLIAVAVSLLLPKYYKATASVLPPKEADMFGSFSAASSVLKGLSGGRALKGLGQSEGAYNYFAILKSRAAMESVVRKFDLINVYDVSDTSMEKAVKQLGENTAFETQDEDNITIEVLDRDPQRAANIANYFVQLLNEISIQLGTQEARNNREFIEKRLEKSREDLRVAEEALRKYQEKSGMIVVIDPTSSRTSGIAELYGMKAKKEIELAILKRTVSPENALVKQAEVELGEFDRKVSTFPGVGMESLRLYRELAIQQKILEFLIPLYEQAKVDEQKDVPVLLVLDKAIQPERKTKPQRVLIVFLTTSLSFLFCILLSFLFHGLANRQGTISASEEVLRRFTLHIASIYKVRLS